MALVVDASALVLATSEETGAARRLLRRLAAEECHAPHLVDAELGNVLRRKVARGELMAEHAEMVLSAAPLLVDRRYDHAGALARLAWALRDVVTFYDGLYVGVAHAIAAPLLTADARLARAPGLPCTVELAG